MDLLSNKIRREQLNLGDHIYTWRCGYSYSHHGIYEGDGKVIHLTRGPGHIIDNSTRSQPSHDRVVRCDIQDFLRDGQLYRFEYGVSKIVFLIKRAGTCSFASSKPPEDVLHHATFLLENGFGDYDLFSKNCEDFAIYCKTGLINVRESASGTSAQISSLVAAFSSVALIPYHLLPSSLIVVALVLCSVYCAGRIVLDVGIQLGFAVVEVEKLKHLNNAHYKGTRRFLPEVRYVSCTLWVIRYWYWNTPESAILLWFKSFVLYVILGDFVFDHLLLYGFKLGEYSAYTILVLGYGYWRWTSDSTLLRCTRFLLLNDYLSSIISYRARSLKLQKYIINTIWVLELWNWILGSTLPLWIKLALVYIFSFYFVPHQLKNHPLMCEAFIVCFVIHSVTPLLGWDYID